MDFQTGFITHLFSHSNQILVPFATLSNKGEEASSLVPAGLAASTTHHCGPVPARNAAPQTS